MHRRLKINKFVEYNNVWKLYICRIHILHASTSENYIFIEYIYLSNTYTTCTNVIKNKFVDYNYAYHKFKYIDLYNIHVDESSTKLHTLWPLVKHITHELRHTFLHVITYTCHDRLHWLRVTYYNCRWHVHLQTTYHDMMTSYTLCL